jgi:hypothetical protein
MEFEDFDNALEVQKELQKTDKEITELTRSHNEQMKALTDKRAKLAAFSKRMKTSLADSVKAVQARSMAMKQRAADKEKALAEQLGIEPKKSPSKIDQAIASKPKQRRQMKTVEPVKVGDA